MSSDFTTRAEMTRREWLLAAAATSLPLITARGAAQTPVWAEPPGTSKELWAWARTQQVLEPNLAWLDTSSDGPVLRAALVAYYRSLESSGLDPYAYRRSTLDASSVLQMLQRVGGALGCEAAELTFTTGATEALNTVAAGLDFSPGDEVVTTSREHDASIYPWLMRAKRHGVAIKTVYLPSPLSGPEEALGRLAGAITPRTRVLAFSHVQYSDGAVLPVRDLCSFARERNILSVVDGALAPGMLEITLRDYGCDFYAGTFHKWLNGPRGLGFLYVRPDALARLWPLQTRDRFGWSATDRYGMAAENASAVAAVPGTAAAPSDSPVGERDQWPPTLRKLCTCLPQSGPLLQALLSTLDFQERVGRARIQARIRELAIYARLRLQTLKDIEFLTPSNPALWAGILSFRLSDGSHERLARTLYEDNGIAVRHIEHPAQTPAPAFDALRISTHAFNSHDDVDRLVRALQSHR